LEAVIDHRLDAFADRNADRPDSVELRVAAVHTVADLLTHVPPDDARRVVEHVAAVTATSIETVVSAVIAAFDREDGTTAPNPAAQSPPTRPAIAAAFPHPSAQPPGSAAAGHPASHTPTLRSPRRTGRR
jgi:hypothetical protein